MITFKYPYFTCFYLCVCIIFGIYLYDTNIPFIKYIDETLAVGLLFFYITQKHYKSKEFKYFFIIVIFYISILR